MPVFGTNLCCNFSYQLHNQFIQLMRANKIGAAAISRARVYSSSGPERYIPKEKRRSLTCPKTEVIEVPSSNPAGDEILRGGNGGQRSFVLNEKSWNRCPNPNDMPMDEDCDLDVAAGDDYSPKLKDHHYRKVSKGGKTKRLNEKSWNRCPNPNDMPMDEDCDLDVAAGDDYSLKLKDHHDRKVSKVGKTKRQVENMSIKLLAARALSSSELRKKLHAEEFPADLIEGTINDFRGRGLINDCSYAESYSWSKWSSSSWGPRRIKQELLKKGISESAAEEAVAGVFKGDEDVEEDELQAFGLSKLSMEQLYAQASKRWVRSQNLAQDKRKTRIIWWLRYRGFHWDVINYILTKLLSQSRSRVQVAREVGETLGEVGF